MFYWSQVAVAVDILLAVEAELVEHLKSLALLLLQVLIL
jgi:hypothetical protein